MTQPGLDLPPERVRCDCWLGDGVRNCETPNECGHWRNALAVAGVPQGGELHPYGQANDAAIKPSEE